MPEYYLGPNGNYYYIRPGGDPNSNPNNPAIFMGSSDVYEVFNNLALSIERSVTLVYPETKLSCTNCSLSNVGVLKSVSIYKQGGPMPFTNGQPCPYCDGKGYKAIEVIEDIKSRIYIDQKSWQNKSISLKLPDGTLQLVTRIEFMSKLKQAKYIMPKYNGLENYQTELYERAEQIYSNSWILNPQKYVTSYWVSKNETN